MKKPVVFITMILGIIVLIGGGMFAINFFKGSKSQLKKTEEQVYSYLIDERGYDPSDIDSIRTQYNWKDEKRIRYQAYVTFSDEKGQEYEYSHNDEDGVIPIGRPDGKGQHNDDVPPIE